MVEERIGYDVETGLSWSLRNVARGNSDDALAFLYVTEAVIHACNDVKRVLLPRKIVFFCQQLFARQHLHQSGMS